MYIFSVMLYRSKDSTLLRQPARNMLIHLKKRQILNESLEDLNLTLS